MKRKRDLPVGVYLRASGRYQAIKSIDGKDVSLGMFDTVKQAQAAVVAVNKELASQLRSSESCRDLIEQWIDERERSGQYRTIKNQRSVLRAHVYSSAWVNKSIRLIKMQDIQLWIKDLENKNVSAPNNAKLRNKRKLSFQTRKHALDLVRIFFSDMRIRGKYGGINPCTGLSAGARDQKIEKRVYLTQEEIERLLDQNMPLRAKAIFTTAIYTGLRAGELFSLYWSDVIFDKEFPHLFVNKARNGTTKNGKSREVPMLPIVQDVLRQWQKESARIGSSFVFPCGSNKSGWQKCGKYYDGQWQTWARAKCGIELPFKNTRHTCGSHLVMGTWGKPQSLERVAKWLGHSDIKVTYKHYAHLSPDALRRSYNEIVETWGPAPVRAPVREKIRNENRP